MIRMPAGIGGERFFQNTGPVVPDSSKSITVFFRTKGEQHR